MDTGGSTERAKAARLREGLTRNTKEMGNEKKKKQEGEEVGESARRREGR